MTASDQAFTGKGIVNSIIITGGSTATLITIYDEASSAKTATAKKFYLKAATVTTIQLDGPFLFKDGCYVDFSTGGTNVAVTLVLQ